MRGAGSDAPRYGVLGPLSISGDGGRVRIKSRQQRLLFVMLLVDANHTVSTDRLADALWGDHLPDDPAGALRTHVSRLRKTLPEGTQLVTDPGGYRLVAEPGEIDAGRFELLLDSAIGLSGSGALRAIDDALRLWRGQPLEEFLHLPFAQIEARRLEERRDGAREQRASLLLAAGRPTDAATDLEALLAERPERERARGLLMEALYQQGRHTAALDVYQSWRRHLAEDRGLAPSPALQEVEQRVLRHSVRDTARPPDSLPGVAVARPVSSFLGRDTDLHGVGDLLGRSRLVTLWGPGGVGKTRLALEVAARVAPDYPDGVHVCDLTVLTPDGSVARAVANNLGVQEMSGRRLDTQLVEGLAHQRALLVLDNCEHVLEGAAQLARRLVESTSGVDVLATSRERLGVDAEQLWEVAPLAVGGAESPAVALFIDRARAADRSFVASPADTHNIAAICRRLDGLPLGVELAAARVHGLTVEDLLGALEQRFEILTGGAGSAVRHRSLRAVVDWSYTQLTPEEQAVFDRLSVFRGPFDLDAAVAIAVTDGIDRPTVIRSVLRLVDCSLLVTHDSSGSVRYSMLETLRDHGNEHLEKQDSLTEARERHARWALAEVERAAPGLGTAMEPERARVIGLYIDELRAAHTWLVGHDLDAALRLSAALRPYALWRGHSEIFRWAEVAAAAASGADHALLPEVFLAASTGAWQRGDVAAARAAAAATDRVARRLGAAANRASLEASGDVAFLTGELDHAVTAFTEAFTLAVAADDPLQAVWDLGSAAVALAYKGDNERAVDVAADVVSTAERSRSPSAIAFSHFVIGEILATTDPEAADAHLRRAIEIAMTAESRFVVGLAEVALAASRTRQQDVASAVTHCESAIRHWHAAGAWAPLWTTLRTVIALLMRVRAFDDAAMLYGAVASPTGARVAPYGADAVMLREAANELQSELGDDSFSHAVDAGRALEQDAAIQFSLDALARVSSAHPQS